MILTDAKGRPFEKPSAPPKGCLIDETIAFVRAMHAYNDRVSDCANTAFNKGLKL